MSLRASDIIPEGFKPPLLRAYRRLRVLNFEHELYARSHTVDGAEFRSYDFLLSTETLLDQLMERSSSGETVYDVGAHVGSYTLPLAAKGCSVNAFEANPVTFERLEANVALNDFDDVETFNVGISEESGSMTFYLADPSSRSSFHRYNATYGGGEIIGEETVPTRRIDDLLTAEGIDPPDHLKIDIEGFGLEALHGAEDTISTHRPVIYFEPHEVDNQDYREDELREFFADRNYDVTEYDYPWVCTPQ